MVVIPVAVAVDPESGPVEVARGIGVPVELVAVHQMVVVWVHEVGRGVRVVVWAATAAHCGRGAAGSSAAYLRSGSAVGGAVGADACVGAACAIAASFCFNAGLAASSARGNAAGAGDVGGGVISYKAASALATATAEAAGGGRGGASVAAR